LPHPIPGPIGLPYSSRVIRSTRGTRRRCLAAKQRYRLYRRHQNLLKPAYRHWFPKPLPQRFPVRRRTGYTRLHRLAARRRCRSGHLHHRYLALGYPTRVPIEYCCRNLDCRFRGCTIFLFPASKRQYQTCHRRRSRPAPEYPYPNPACIGTLIEFVRSVSGINDLRILRIDCQSSNVQGRRWESAACRIPAFASICALINPAKVHPGINSCWILRIQNYYIDDTAIRSLADPKLAGTLSVRRCQCRRQTEKNNNAGCKIDWDALICGILHKCSPMCSAYDCREDGQYFTSANAR